MVVARTVGRIPGASGGEAFFSRRHWDDPLRAAAEAAAEAARRNYDARGEWGSVAADLAASGIAHRTDVVERTYPSSLLAQNGSLTPTGADVVMPKSAA